jgi:hypothetical protein
MTVHFCLLVQFLQWPLAGAGHSFEPTTQTWLKEFWCVRAGRGRLELPHIHGGLSSTAEKETAERTRERINQAIEKYRKI